MGKYCNEALYAEVGEKNFDAIMSAKIASLDDNTQYVPMASLSESLTFHRNINSLPPPAYSSVVSQAVALPVAPSPNIAAQDGSANAAPTYCPVVSDINDPISRVSDPISNAVVATSQAHDTEPHNDVIINTVQESEL